MAYQTLTIGVDDGEPDATLNAEAAAGWRVHTVLSVSEDSVQVLMERVSEASSSRHQPPRPAPRRPDR